MSDTQTKTPRMSPGTVENLSTMITYAEKSIVSRTLMSQKSGTLTLFAFDAEQRLSEHTAPFDAFVHVLDGTAEVTIDGKAMRVSSNEVVLMPAGIPHAVYAPARFKMMLVMFKNVPS